MAKDKDKTDTDLPVPVEESKLPALAGLDFEADAASVQETLGKDDLAIPFIGVCQGLSPQLIKSKPEFIQGIGVGDIFNSVTKEFCVGTEGLIVVPALYVRTFVEWVPREKGGGFVADHGLETGLEMQKTVNENGVLPNGNQLVETHYHFVLAGMGNDFKRGLIAMSSSSLRPSRVWNTLVSQVRLERKDGSKFQPARPYMSYHMKTVEQSNDKGTWYNWNVVAHGPTVELPNGVELYKEAMEFAKQMQESGFRPVPPAEAAAPADSGESANY